MKCTKKESKSNKNTIRILRVQKQKSMIKKIILSMTKDEARCLKLFLNRTTEGAHRKDIYLFDQLRRNNTPEDFLCEKLSGGNRNTYYRLKNRLKTDIGKSLLAQHATGSSEQEIINSYVLANLFFRRQEYEICGHYLSMAERKARQFQNLELLNLIYSDQIKLSRETLDKNPTELIEKRKMNRQELSKISELDDLLALLMFKIKASQNYATKSDNILDLLSETIKVHSSEAALRSSPIVRFKMYHGVSRILLQNQDFLSLETYLSETLNEFEQDQLFNKRNHDTKLQMLTYLCNAFFENEKYSGSLECAEKLLLAMREFNYLLYDKYVFYYYSVLYYNHSVTDPPKALKILLEASEDDVIKKDAINTTFILLQLTVYYVTQTTYEKAHEQLKQLLVSSGFDKLDDALIIKIALLELLILSEIGEVNAMEECLIKMKKHQSKHNWKEKGCQREGIMLSVIELLTMNRSPKEEQTLAGLIADLGTTNNRSDLINYSDWLKRRSL